MPPDQSGNSLLSLVPFGIMALIFYFIVIMPEKKKQKELKDKIAKLQKNDQIVTTGGIHGIVVNLKESTVIVRVDDNVKIEFDRDAILTVAPKS